MKARLVRFEHPLRGTDQAVAFNEACRLSKVRGLPLPPTRYRTKVISVKIHPDDVLALRAFCEQLTALSSDA